MDGLPIIPNAGDQELDERQHVKNILSYHIVLWRILLEDQLMLLVNEETKSKNILS